MNDIKKTIKKIKELKAKHPKLHMHYYDNGAWALYESKKHLNLAQEDEDSVKTLLEGDDGLSDGYAPFVALLLAEALGITIDSI